MSRPDKNVRIETEHPHLVDPAILAVFAEKLEDGHIPEPNTGCWLWRHPGKRHGEIRIRKQRIKAHRVSFRLSRGRWPFPGMWVCHHCDVMECVNPDHLYEGTPAQNNRDKSVRLRVHGSRNPCARLHESDIPVIRQRIAAGETKYEIARSYGVAASTIFYIKAGVTWTHV